MALRSDGFRSSPRTGCIKALLITLKALAVFACGPGGGNTITPPPPPPIDPTSLSQAVQPILTRNCAFAACHAGTTPQQGMNLAVGQTFSNTVNVASSELPRLMRVEPGNPDSSYLILKIEGQAGLVGGIGTQMPLGDVPLTQAQIDTVRGWVAAGASNN